MFLWWSSNSLQIIEFHADAWSWRRLIADRHVFAVAVLHMWNLGIVPWQDKTWGTPNCLNPICAFLLYILCGVCIFGFSGDVGRNVFSEWLEIETERSVRCTMPSNKHVHSEVFRRPAKSCDVRMLWIQCSAQCKACCVLVQVLSEHPHVLHTAQVPTQNMYIFSVFRSVLFVLIPFCLTFHRTVYLHMQCTFS